jgi:hypothetical protein
MEITGANGSIGDTMQFYNVNIEKPQSAYHGKSNWHLSTIGQLHRQTDGGVFVREIPYHSRGAMYGWRVMDAYFTDEDSTMTHFRAFDQVGTMMPEATFGVRWDGCPHHIRGGLAYQPEFGNGYYVPVDNKFVTVASSGYTVQVLDRQFPSEGLEFGLHKKDGHKALVISFRLMLLNSSYPNDVEVY